MMKCSVELNTVQSGDDPHEGSQVKATLGNTRRELVHFCNSVLYTVEIKQIVYSFITKLLAFF